MENCIVYLGGFSDCGDFLGINKGMSAYEKKASLLAKKFLGKLYNPYFCVRGKNNPNTSHKERCLTFNELYSFEKEEAIFYEEDFWDEFGGNDELFSADVEKHTEIIQHKASEYRAPIMFMNLSEIIKNKKAHSEVFKILEENFADNGEFCLSFSVEKFTSVPNGDYSLLKNISDVPYYRAFFDPNEDFSNGEIITGRVILSVYHNDELKGSFYLNEDGSVCGIPDSVTRLFEIQKRLYDELGIFYKEVVEPLRLCGEEQKREQEKKYPFFNSIAFEYWDALRALKPSYFSLGVA